RVQHGEPIALVGATCRARAVPVAYQPGLFQIVPSAMPVTALDVELWCDHLRSLNIRRVRTSALTVDQWSAFAAADFHDAQRLTMLRADHDALTGRQARAMRRAHQPRRLTRSLTSKDLEDAAAVDLSAFGFRWALGPDELNDVALATPFARSRQTNVALGGFLISGRDHRRGYIQRLAVHPDHQGRGLSHALLSDALRWLTRARCRDALVNTHHDNIAALALYRAHGFVALPDPLLVGERAL
ncbi:MAG TPA: N-acetyltransferase, partial [Ilumatobacteraceae bacterium]|nr:N-acetyltransferase [Ilumatobacteraceae bacterium]